MQGMVTLQALLHISVPTSPVAFLILDLDFFSSSSCRRNKECALVIESVITRKCAQKHSEILSYFSITGGLSKNSAPD